MHFLSRAYGLKAQVNLRRLKIDKPEREAFKVVFEIVELREMKKEYIE